LRRPSCKAKSNWLLPSYEYSHYWQQRCPRMPSLFRRCCKNVGQIQGRLNNILGTGKSSALGTLPTQPLTATGIKL
jgi:hypothetical protein